MVFSIFHFLKHYYNGIFHISFFKALLIGRSGYFLKQGIFIYKYDSCVDFFNTITEQFSFWESDKWFKSYARFKYRNLLLNFIQDGRHLCCIYGRIQCRLLVKDRILHAIFFILLEDCFLVFLKEHVSVLALFAYFLKKLVSFQVSSHFRKMKKDASLDFCASSGC